MRNYIGFITIVGLILTGSIQAGISLNTSLSSDPILISSAPSFGEYIAKSQYAEENELSAEEEKYLKSPFCLSEFVPEGHRPQRTANIDWASDDEILYLSDLTVGGEWVDEFFNLDFVPVYWSENNRVNEDGHLSETIYSFHDRIFSTQSSNIFTF
jgi:hypothetical protein